ncbi:hypothetical protein CDAR_67171 [Caerostris darwini]|uniref:Uncharacterized protein n=1 Tax=Caerostris darwini TaxID=1538125 RepID=A0AAV4R5G5_9ARAC|nr:hypothetical protein CDAR_67171 [Caerostris darwini]
MHVISFQYLLCGWRNRATATWSWDSRSSSPAPPPPTPHRASPGGRYKVSSPHLPIQRERPTVPTYPSPFIPIDPKEGSPTCWARGFWC